MYLNNELQTDTIQTNSPVGNYTTTIGAHIINSESYFEGKIDDIRIYNRALSEEEIQALYHEGGWGK